MHSRGQIAGLFAGAMCLLLPSPSLAETPLDRRRLALLKAHDARYISDNNFVRTVPVPTMGVGTTEFDLSREKSEALYEAGYKAGQKFFKGWDFEAYKRTYRQAKAISRTLRLALPTE